MSIKITATTLNLVTQRLTATVVIDAGNGETLTTNPDFSEADLLAQAAKAEPPRTDWNTEDVLALATAVFSAPEVAQPEAEPAPEAQA